MSSRSSKTADIAGLRKIAQAAIKATFPKAKLVKQFAKLAEATGSEAEAAESKRQTARLVCQCAEKYRTDALKDTSDISTILDCWRDHWKLLIVELHASQSPFVEMGEANRQGEQKPVMTGYGRNIASAARGIIEHDIALVDADGKTRPYTDLTAEIVKARRKGLPREQKTLNAAKEKLADAVSELRKVCKRESDAYSTATQMVAGMTEIMRLHGSDGLIFLALYVSEFNIADYAEATDETPEADADATIADDDASEATVIAV